MRGVLAGWLNGIHETERVTDSRGNPQNGAKEPRTSSEGYLRREGVMGVPGYGSGQTGFFLQMGGRTWIICGVGVDAGPAFRRGHYYGVKYI